MASNPSLLNGSAVKEQLATLVGPDHVRPAGPDDSVAGIPAQWVVEPGSELQVASTLRFLNGAQLSVIPRGSGSKLGWGNPPKRADVILSLTRLNQVVEHAWGDLTVTVEAGCSIGELQRTLGMHGQRLAVDPLWPERATVGGVLSANDTGALRLCFGGLRDLVIGITLALADGTLAKSGGKVVKNVAGYDLPKLVTGAMGTLGVITRAVFRVHPLPANSRTLSLRAPGAEEMQRLILDLLASNLSHTSIQIRQAAGGAPMIDIELEGTEAGIAAQERRIREIARATPVDSATASVWSARQALWSTPGSAAVAKTSVIPSDLQKMLAALARLAGMKPLAWQAVIQATGIGWLRVDAGPETSSAILEALRAEVEGYGGSLVVARPPAAAAIEAPINGEIAPRAEAKIDAWGRAGDALPLMFAMKKQFDPEWTLNPGRYVGGI